jgi:hypothetical protein
MTSFQYTLHYATLDDAITYLNHLGCGALMAKVDLKVAFRMIPVAKQDWDTLERSISCWQMTALCLRSPPFLFTQFAIALPVDPPEQSWHYTSAALLGQLPHRRTTVLPRLPHASRQHARGT